MIGSKCNILFFVVTTMTIKNIRAFIKQHKELLAKRNIYNEH